MAATLGKDGGVVVSGSAVTFIDSWSLDMNSENVDVTAYGDTARVRKQTFKDWGGSFSGTLDLTDAAQAALLDQMEDGTLSEVDLRLKDGASSYWYGSAVLSNISVNSNVSDRVTISFSFESAGGLFHT